MTENRKIVTLLRLYAVFLMKKQTNLIRWLILGGICAGLSCNLLKKFNKPFSGLSTTNLSAITSQNTDAVNVEIFTIRLAPHHYELVQQLWHESDEQSLPPQLRRELYAQGFRVGILGNLLSPALGQLLAVTSDGKTDTTWGVLELSPIDAAREPTATRNVRNLLPDMRTLIKIFDTPLPEQSLFWTENGMMHGQTYTDVIGLLCVSATANRNGSAQIQIVPELEYGIAKLRLRPVSGKMIHDVSRPRHSFESLTVSQPLLPGQWLVMGTTAPDSAGAGKIFFTRRSTGLEQRLLAIRLINATTATVPASDSPTMTLAH